MIAGARARTGNGIGNVRSMAPLPFMYQPVVATQVTSPIARVRANPAAVCVPSKVMFLPQMVEQFGSGGAPQVADPAN